MNQVMLLGRLTKDPGKYPGVVTFTLAVDRRFKRDGEPTADFFNCVAFGKTADFVAKYFFKGKRIGLTGRIENGSYTNKDGHKVSTTSIIAESVEFVDDKPKDEPKEEEREWLPVPEGVQEELPFMV